MTAHLSGVTGEYKQLFEQAESLSGDAGNLVFTGGEDDPETLETLSNMGFKRPADISAIIRGWHAGRMAATRSERAREILTRLQPVLLEKLAQARAPDDGFLRFDQFLTALPAGVQIFSLFQSNPPVLNLLIDIINTAPRLAALLSANAKLVDALVPGHMAEELPRRFTDFESAMDGLRRHVHEAQFRVGTRSLADPIMAIQHGEDYSRLAETAISTMYDAALADIERQYGRVDDGDMLVLGLGKLGSGEMTLQSDLDLIVICDCPDFAALSNGAKPLDADRWFARAARRMISGLSAPTSEGDLFEVDTRLRPSGNAGPLVTKFSSFVDYQQNQAWNWEHMALTRGRVLAGGAALREKVEATIKNVLTAPRDVGKLADDAEDMRARLRKHQPQAGPFDIRRGDGGLVDVEFIAQCLQLAQCARHEELAVPMRLPNLLSVLRDTDCLDAAAYEGLQQTYKWKKKTAPARQRDQALRQSHKAQAGQAPDRQILPEWRHPQNQARIGRSTHHHDGCHRFPELSAHRHSCTYLQETCAPDPSAFFGHLKNQNS